MLYVRSARFRIAGVITTVALTMLAGCEAILLGAFAAAQGQNGAPDYDWTESYGSNLTVQADNLAFYDAGGTLGFYGNSAICTVGSCSGEVKGFIGASAQRAGAIYQVNVNGVPLPGPVIGSAAFANTQ